LTDMECVYWQIWSVYIDRYGVCILTDMECVYWLSVSWLSCLKKADQI